MRHLLIGGIILWLAATPVYAATMGQDDFTTASDTLLESWTPTCGGGSCGNAWTPELTGTLTVNAANDYLWCTTCAAARWARKEDNLGNDEHCVQATIAGTIGTTRYTGVVGRMPSSGFGSGFVAAARGDSTTVDIVLATFSGGTQTAELGRYQWNAAAGTNVGVRLCIGNGSQTVEVDTGGGFTQQITGSEPDTTFQGNQYAGIMITTAASTHHVDNFLTTATAAGGPGPRAIIINRNLLTAPKEWLHALYHRLRTPV